MQRVSQVYMQTQVTTTSQGDILIMLYDGAIKFLSRAKELIEAKDVAGKGNAISKALDIINELDGTLNLEKGGDLAANLHNLYFFCNARLLMANLKMDAKLIDEVIKVLSGLRSAYAEVNATAEGKAAAQEIASAQRAAASLPQRGQTGVAGGGIPMPGAGARARSVYAAGTAPSAPLAASAEPEAPNMEETANAVPAPTETPSIQIETQTPPQEESKGSLMPPPSSGFGAGMAGAAMYKRYAAKPAG